VFRGDRYFWYRKDDGFFQQGSFSKKVAGVIAIRKREKKPICYYYMILYVNDAFKCYVDNIDGLLEFSKVVYRNMRPPSGKGGLWT